MKKFSKGIHPDLDDDWSVLGSFIDEDRKRWIMYRKDHNSGDLFITMKVAVMGKAKGKANYWLSFSRLNDLLCCGSELCSMIEHRNDLYESLMQHLDKWGRK